MADKLSERLRLWVRYDNLGLPPFTEEIETAAADAAKLEAEVARLRRALEWLAEEKRTILWDEQEIPYIIAEALAAADRIAAMTDDERTVLAYLTARGQNLFIGITAIGEGTKLDCQCAETTLERMEPAWRRVWENGHDAWAITEAGTAALAAAEEATPDDGH